MLPPKTNVQSVVTGLGIWEQDHPLGFYIEASIYGLHMALILLPHVASLVNPVRNFANKLAALCPYSLTVTQRCSSSDLSLLSPHPPPPHPSHINHPQASQETL